MSLVENTLPRPLVWCSWCHEPIQFYLRRSAAPASVVGAGRWIPAWYDRIHTREALKRAADLGVNFIYTHFYKGFGLKFEREQMKRTAGLAEIARELGITCVGYCTLPTVYYETIVEELPDIGSCLRRNMDGSIQPYSSAGYRAYVCYNSRRYYEEYYPELIRFGLEEVGLAGFHFDNAGETPCWCGTCRRKFREYLARTQKDPGLFGLGSWDHVELPGVVGRELDSVAVEWYRWRRQVCSERHRAVFRLVKERDPEAIVLYNPGLGRFAAGGYEPLDAPKEADIAFLETSRAITLENGMHITGTAGFKLASLCDIVPLNASWLREDGAMRVHRTWEEIALCCAEQMVFAGNCGAHWLVRPAKKGDRMICDDPEQYRMAERCFSYFRANSSLYAGTKQVSQVCLYYSRDSRLLFPDRFREEIQRASELLREKKITWRFVSENSAPPAPGEKLLLAGAYMLSDREVENIRLWHVPVASLSDAGVLDERGWEREEIPFPAGGTDELTGMFKMDFPHGVIEIAVSGDALLLHLLNMDNGQTVTSLEVELPFDAEKAACFSFEPEVRAELKTPRQLVIRDLKTFCTVKLTGDFSAAVSGCGSDKPNLETN